jgi:hypothetical protein
MCADSSTLGPGRATIDVRQDAPDDGTVGEYALVTAAVAALAISIATIPEGQLAARLPTTSAKARALVVRDARAHHISAGDARTVLAHAPYRRAPLRYLYVSGWLDGRKNPASCVFAKATPGGTTSRLGAAIRADRRLVSRLARMQVTPVQAARAVVRGTAAAC